MPGPDLSLLWAAVILFGVVMYVILDGFDLGVGILFPFAPDERSRDVMMNAVAPFWDGNETWLVLGGVSLFVAFPVAYAELLSHLYLPVVLFLIGLVFRGVAFEFRGKADSSKILWSAAFAGGSWTAAFAHGLILGAVIQGLPFGPDGRPLPDPLVWATPFGVFVGLAVVAGYALLGASWLLPRVEGELGRWLLRIGPVLVMLVLGAILAVSIWTPLTHPAIARRWFSLPQLVILMPAPAVTAGLGLALLLAFARGWVRAAFPLTVGLFLLALAGVAISLWPYAVPYGITIAEAASHPDTQAFMLVGVLLFLPLVLGYTFYVYRVFRGQVRPEEKRY